MPRTGSQRQYAKHRKVSHTAVQRAIAAGRIPVRRDGTIDFDLADKIWAALTRPRRHTDVPDEKQAAALLRARATRMISLAGLMQLAYLKRKDELLPTEEVSTTAAKHVAIIREGLGAMVERIAARGPFPDEATAHVVLTEEVRRTLTALSETFGRAAREDGSAPTH